MVLLLASNKRYVRLYSSSKSLNVLCGITNLNIFPAITDSCCSLCSIKGSKFSWYSISVTSLTVVVFEVLVGTCLVVVDLTDVSSIVVDSSVVVVVVVVDGVVDA